MSDDLVGSLSNCAIFYNVKENVNQSNLDEQEISVWNKQMEVHLGWVEASEEEEGCWNWGVPKAT